MPVQAAQWNEFLSCPICYNEFDAGSHRPVSLGCSHTVCKTCLHKLHRKACPFDQTTISTDIDLLPVNRALLLLVGAQVPEGTGVCLDSAEDTQHYGVCTTCVEELALYLKPISGGKGVAGPSTLSRSMQRKLVTLVNCQLLEEEGRVRAIRAGRSLGERTVTELILQHQNPQQLSANLWAAVRARGCQFLGPAMQEDALKLVLLALEDGSALSRKVLVLFVLQKLEARFPQASKTSIGHVVQLLYRASCFKVTKRDEDSSLMQLKEEFRMYEALRREHDAQIVHIAMEAGLRISPEQWSSLLYGDLLHRSHMQSIIDKLQSPESFVKSVQELTIVLQRTSDPANITSLRAPLELLASVDHNPDTPGPTWLDLERVMLAVKAVVHGLVDFIQNFSKKNHETFQSQPNSKYKTSMCRDLRHQGTCPRGSNCTFAHTQDELEKYRMRNKKVGGAKPPVVLAKSGSALVPPTTDVALGVPLNHEQEGVVSEGPSPTHLVPRGGEQEQSDVLHTPTNGTNELPAISQDEKPVFLPKHLVSASQSPDSGPHPAGSPMVVDTALPTRRGAQAEMASYCDQRPLNDLQCYRFSSKHYSSMTNSHKPCLARFTPSSPALEPPVSPSMAPPYLEQPPPLWSHCGPSTYPSTPHHHPPSHGVYAPVYDSRRAWRPQLYHRQEGRSNSLPLELLHSAVYQPPLRERFSSLDSPHGTPADRRTMLHRARHRGEDRVHHEQWPPQSSKPTRGPLPLFTVDVCSEDGVCGGCKCGGGEGSLGRYSPWSCDPVGSLESGLGTVSAHSCTQHAPAECAGRCISRLFEPYRRMRDEDPIIPFGEGPIISKWGAIARASRTDASAPHGRPNTTPSPMLFSCRDNGFHRRPGNSQWAECGISSTCLLERHRSFGNGVKPGAELLVQGGTLIHPDRDTEQELSALHMEDQPSQELQPETGNRLSSVFTDPVSRSQIDQPTNGHLDVRVLKMAAFRRSVSPGRLDPGGLCVERLAVETGDLPVNELEMLLHGC